MAVDTLIGADRIGFCAADDFEKLPLALKIGAVAFRDTPSIAVVSVTIDLYVFSHFSLVSELVVSVGLFVLLDYLSRVVLVVYQSCHPRMAI